MINRYDKALLRLGGVTLGAVLTGAVLLATLPTLFLAPPPPFPLRLKSQIDSIYVKSVKECSAFFAGNEECVKRQFSDNYRWEVVQDQDRVVGAPGVPGASEPTGPTGR